MSPVKQSLINAVATTLGQLVAHANTDEHEFISAVKQLEHLSRAAQLDLIRRTIIMDPAEEGDILSGFDSDDDFRQRD